MTAMQGRGRRPIGFTLVELLVVIVIITALAAILVPAVYVAIQRAKQARMGLEVAGLARALERYKLEYGEYPPDFTDAWDSQNNRMDLDRVKAVISNHLATHFRRRAGDDLPRDAELLALNPATALIFWLKGFSPDPQYPLTGAGERSSYFDFNKGRVTIPNGLAAPNLDPPSQHVFHYYPDGDPTKQPYIYFSGASYGAYDPDPDRNSQTPPPAPADQNQPTHRILDWAKQFAICPPFFSSIEQRFAEPEKFQVISAGLDGIYDDPDLAPGRHALSSYPTVPKSSRTVTKPLKDNLTSFSEGIIGDLIED